MIERTDSAVSRPGRGFSYLVMVGGAVALFSWIRSRGEQLVALAPPTKMLGAAVPRAAADALFHVLLALVCLIALARALGAVLRHLHQPPVIAEVIAGLLLGPSFLGRITPAASTFLLPPSIAPMISLISQVGLIVYMFLVGLQVDETLIHKHGNSSIAVSHASIIVPFLLGSGLALWLYPRYSSREVPFTVFALFIGISMSVTAFPVLARILTDRGLQSTRLGAVALTCAAVDDATAWCLLALVVGAVRGQAAGTLMTVALTATFVVAMVVFVRPAALRVVRSREARGRLSQGTLAAVLLAALIAALATEAIGIHALFGAFLLGVLIPHDSVLARDLASKLEDLVVVVFLPAFFALTGMRTQIGLIGTLDHWVVCAVIVMVATLGKVGGSAAVARITGLGWRQAMSLGVLMNTRGIMELIILNIGLDLGVLSPALFTILVVMAIVTTMATGPCLHWILSETPGFGHDPARS
jgi:Kef-type K+ transport system membrane component KefB